MPPQTCVAPLVKALILEGLPISNGSGYRRNVNGDHAYNPGPMYSLIQDWVRSNCGWAPKTCWIAHCKELAGLPVRRAWNRRSDERAVPCPAEKQTAIFAAFRHFGMIAAGSIQDG